jgi:hypothetical protein
MFVLSILTVRLRHHTELVEVLSKSSFRFSSMKDYKLVSSRRISNPARAFYFKD